MRAKEQEAIDVGMGEEEGENGRSREELDAEFAGGPRGGAARRGRRRRGAGALEIGGAYVQNDYQKRVEVGDPRDSRALFAGFSSPFATTRYQTP